MSEQTAEQTATQPAATQDRAKVLLDPQEVAREMRARLELLNREKATATAALIEAQNRMGSLDAALAETGMWLELVVNSVRNAGVEV